MVFHERVYMNVSKTGLSTVAFALFVCEAILLISVKAYALIWAPSQRIGPAVTIVEAEKWNGYESYDGFFWMQHWFKWSESEISRLRNDPRVSDGDDIMIYEFRRGWANDDDNELYERWDGVWAKSESRCIYLGICLFRYNVQMVYDEYITSLPNGDNHGTEEYDGWFGIMIDGSVVAWRYDKCHILEGTRCDEEYEISADPLRLQPNHNYFVAVKFRTDARDGTLPTDWYVTFLLEEVEQFGRWLGWNNHFGRNTHSPCTTDTGNWRIEYGPSPTYHKGNRPRDPDAHCLDRDGDGLIDRDDLCDDVPNLNDNDDADGDGKGDACDDDADDDGVPNSADAFPHNPAESRDTDDDGIGNNADEDDDGDGYTDDDELDAGSDPLSVLSVPADCDGDYVSDANDDDDDNDGVSDTQDAFPCDQSEQLDTDGDGIGNNADIDDDGDLYTDGVEAQVGSDPLDPASVPPDHDGDLIPDALDPDDDNDGVPDINDAFPFSPVESVDTDGDGIGDNADTDDDNDGYSDAIEISEGTNHRNASSRPLDYDHDFIPNSADPDDDNDGVPDVSDAFPFNAGEWNDADDDGIGDVADLDDDNDGMPDAWERANGLNPLDPSDAAVDSDGDDFNNLYEYIRGSDPFNDCSPNLRLNLCYNFYPDGDPRQCVGATGIQCVPLGEWTPKMWIETDDRSGGCWQSFSIRSECDIDLELCVDFQGDSPTADIGQCQDVGMYCAPVNEWTEPIRLDMDGRNGWCNEQFFISGEDDFTLEMEFTADVGGDSNGQCKNTGLSRAFSAYDTGTDIIGLDTDNRAGGCLQRFRLLSGTYSITAF